jgi:hypothetical protein
VLDDVVFISSALGTKAMLSPSISVMTNAIKGRWNSTRWVSLQIFTYLGQNSRRVFYSCAVELYSRQLSSRQDRKCRVI